MLYSVSIDILLMNETLYKLDIRILKYYIVKETK